MGLLAAISVLVLWIPTTAAHAMEAPGGGDEDWIYSEEDHGWYYREESGRLHTGWLKDEGEWYWFDGEGRMADGGEQYAGSGRYYFFPNGQMAWNQYVGMKYYDEEGQVQDDRSVRTVGSGSPSSEDKDLFSDAMYYVPRSWIAQFVKDDWQFMFYTKKKYFEAPETSAGIYYVYHDVDTRYKKIKLTRGEDALQAFGEYVGYASGCYRKDSQWMKTLWAEYPSVNAVLNIPDYYASNGRFYFGKLFGAYLNEETRDSIQRMSPKACEVMEEILHWKDDEETRARYERARQQEQQAEAARQEQIYIKEGYGPGVKRPEENTEK